MARRGGDATAAGAGVRPPVFIIGGSRTGSEMLKTMLSVSPEIDFVDELFLLCPRWLHKDLATCLATEVGDLDAPGALERVVDLLFSGRPYGWVWSVANQKFDRERLKQELTGTSLSLRDILAALMEVHAERRGKQGRGAKFPTHYSCTHRLLEWFPECKLIHTTRDPRAVYASQAGKYVKAADPWHVRGCMRFRQFVHVNIQVSWTASLHRRMKRLPNYRLVRYEDVVTEPRPQLESLCEFLEVEFLPEMLHPRQYGSTFESAGRRGVNKASLSAWRKRASPLATGAIWYLHPRARRILGYAN